jgi:hypothetical protein
MLRAQCGCCLVRWRFSHCTRFWAFRYTRSGTLVLTGYSRVLTGPSHYGVLTGGSGYQPLCAAVTAGAPRTHRRRCARACTGACSGTARVCSDVRVLTGYSKVLKGTHTVPRNLPRTSNARSGSSGRTRATRQALHCSVGYTEYALCGMAVSGTPRHSRRPSWASVFDGQVLNAAWSRSCRAV